MSSIATIHFLAALKLTALAAFFMPVAAIAQGANLATETGYELGATVSGYEYAEPGVMTLKAKKIGFDVSGTYAFEPNFPATSNDWFVRWKLRYATGAADYSSPISGTINGRSDRYYEAKALVGKDLYLGGYVLTPYVGLGYRYLVNDLRGTTSTGSFGYRRNSTYFSLPVGVTHKMRLDAKKQLHTTFEFSYLIRGTQGVNLSDLPINNAAYQSDVSLHQRSGHGLSLQSMLSFDGWSVGPYIGIWRVQDSDVGGTPAVLEPKNSTNEVGIKASYLF
jgi:hypothetical protein